MILDAARNPATATGLLVFPRNTEVRHHAGWLEVRTPENPGYHDGNGLVLLAPPERGALATWRGRWRARFAPVFGIQQERYEWELPDPAVPAAWPEAEAAGFSVHGFVSLRLQPGAAVPRTDAALPLRPLRGDCDWAGQSALVAAVYPNDPEFIRWHHAAYRDLIDTGRGTWLGAFDGDRLVASAGLFWSPADPDAPARFQEVVTHSDYRRRGLASAILTRLAQTHAAERPCIIVSDPETPATALYSRLGFVPVSTQLVATRALG